MSVTVHPSAIVDEAAVLADGVNVGPFCHVGPKVELGAGVRLVSHVSVAGVTRIGAGTTVYPFAALGQAPQDLKYKGEDTELIVGAANVIREHVTMHTGTVAGRGRTVVGDNCFFMAGSHVAHDCIVGDNVIFANNATLGGRVVIDDFVTIGGLSAVHQLGRVGRYAFIGGGAPVTGDVIPYGMVDNNGDLHGLNIIGMERRGFSREDINTLRAVYRTLFHGDGRFADRFEAIAESYQDHERVSLIIEFIQADTKRPLCQPRRGK